MFGGAHGWDETQIRTAGSVVRYLVVTVWSKTEVEPAILTYIYRYMSFGLNGNANPMFQHLLWGLARIETT